MAKIPLDEAQPGQTLSRPVHSATGQLLMQAGLELTDSTIERLRAMEIDSIVIAGAGEHDKPREVVARELEERFQGHEHDPWMMELKAIVARQLGLVAPTDHA